MNNEFTMVQKIKLLKKKGTILTFKTPVNWHGKTHNQIMTEGVRKEKKSYYIIGSSIDSEAKPSLEELTELINWQDYQERVAFSKIK